jgi:O-antigen/teichoic acid export membrane protein
MPLKFLAFARRPVMRRVAHSVLTGFVGQLALIASGVILARSLGVHDRGRLAVLVLTASVVSQLGTMGVPTALTYATARGEGIGRRVFEGIGRLISVQVTIAMAIQLTVLLAITRSSRGVGGVLIPAALVLTFSTMLQQYALAALQGARRFRAFNVCRTIPAAGFSALAGATTAFTHIDLRLAIVLLAATNSVAAAATIATVCVRRPTGERRPLDCRKLIRFGLRALLNASSPVDTLRLDQAVVGLFLSARALGLYVVAAAFTNLPRFVAQSVGMIAYPEVAAAHAKRDARRKVWSFLAVGTSFVLLLGIALEVAAGWLIRLFFGAEFVPATNACRLLIGAAALVGIRRILSDSLNGLGKPQLGSYAEVVSWIGLILTLPAGAILGGLPGVAASLLVSAAGSLGFLAAAGLGSPSRASQMQSIARIAWGAGRGLFANVLRDGAIWSSIAVPGVASFGGVALVLWPTRDATLTVGAITGCILAALIVAARSLRTLGSILILLGAATLAMTGVRVASWMALSDFFFLAAAIVLIPDTLLGLGRPSEVRQRQIIGLALIMTGGLASAFVAENWRTSSVNFVKLLIASALILLLINVWRPTTTDLKRITFAWIGSATASALWAAKDPSAYVGRPSGLAEHPNALALTCVLALGPVMLLIRELRSSGRFTAILIAAVLVWGIVISGSRAGVLGAAAVFLLSLAICRRRSIVAVALTAGAVAALLLGGFHPKLPAANAISRLVDRNSASVVESDAGRTVALHDAIRTISRHPFTGVGFDQAEAAHNIYLQAWESGGILTLLGFLIVAWATLKPLRVIARRSRDGQYAEKTVAVGISLGFAGYLVAGFFQNAMWERYIWLMPALVAAAWPVRHGWLAWYSSPHRKREALLQMRLEEVAG